MRIRQNPLPQRLLDIACFVFIITFLPIVVIYEIVVVLPAIHEPGGFLHSFTFLMILFLFSNIKGNFIACIVVDTSVDERFQVPQEGDAERLNWRHCTTCDRLSPPRSWHCKVCGNCILKRDHHCIFMGCCIGHQNHRFFLNFTLFMFVGSVYALVYNSLYMWVLNGATFWSLTTLFKMFCPMVMFIVGDFWPNMQILFYALNVMAFIYTVLVLAYHLPIVMRGAVCAETDKQISYNNGLYRNLTSIFGQRMHVAWLSPFIESQLPDDGYNWKPVEPKKTS